MPAFTRRKEPWAVLVPDGWAPREKSFLIGLTERERRLSEEAPLHVFGFEGDAPFLWLFAGAVYVTDDAELTSEDVLALVNEKANQRRLQLEKAHALQAMTAELNPKNRRQPIPQDVKIAVWQRDGGRCVQCGSNDALEFDHIIPIAMGGANTLRNLQLLCEICNRRKGATLG